MYIAGIDIGKFTHKVTIIDTNGTIIKKTFKITF
ncbi:IS110 family transposase [Clostridium bornimense]|nr:IS110 family transposase [Clostridium bornimense]